MCMQDSLFEKRAFNPRPKEWEEASFVKSKVKHILSRGDNLWKSTGVGKKWSEKAIMADT